ncbi:cysteine synthase [Rhodobium orientis]|uniref:Pyridoxal-5'-phosphate-dependent protein subunit beta n=1 Tax=Rhodobium orientis TaxID=34017 RepID=A0A327JJC4_9HYPH|nr:pyridoxal-phosphate dependent enzyme [Rhodobium orientis]MBB4304717.1 cysteine synthase [Rhodobium orientis]MBK5952079.1 pyridoxal-5'-phosphate-dependent protein subunit beta [Rhodobium orientis]RAI26520.1 pyridoxal-5'-phosphate-dependent protein subunit beta [Rhodobium orientis]
MSLGLERDIIDQAAYDKNLQHLRGAGVTLPKIADLADPPARLAGKMAEIAGIDPDTPAAENLFRVHWHNDAGRRGLAPVPDHVVLGPELTGVEAKIVVALGNRFPMIHAHKVLAAYGCLVPRLLSGKFDAGKHRAVWPSTGNYCRGGVAISRILGCRSVAVLPEGMSKERFRWLEEWTADPADIIRTPGTESNVKEIYDACHELAKDDENIIFNQFSEFGNYIVHRAVTGPALARTFAAVGEGLRPRAFVSASGSAGTLAAGDFLKAELGTDICVVEATECPTLLYNGYGEHNIQGIGDKHVPLIHNIMNTDFVIGVSDRATDNLNLVFNTTAGRDYLRQRTGLSQEALSGLGDLGLSSIANILGAVKYAKYMGLGPDDAVLTVATDGAAMYETELAMAEEKVPGGRFEALDAAEAYGRYMLGAATDHTMELGRFDRERIFNLGYYTWVEQQGVSLADFDVRRDQGFWNGLMDLVGIWDGMIEAFNKA